MGGVAFLVLASVAVWFWLSHRQTNAEGASARFSTRMTTTVGVAVSKKGDIQIFLNGLGTVTPPATVTVKPQVSGAGSAPVSDLELPRRSLAALRWETR